jgi:hypothetical protein
MAKTVLSGTLAGGSFALAGPGKLLAVLLSHAEASPQTVTFYDDTAAPSAGNELLVVHVAPEQCPCYLAFPRDLPLQFSTGLALDPGTCDVHLWAVGYGS